MNQSEFEALSQPISNDARILYLLGLRPNSNAITGLTEPVDYKALMNLLNSKEQKFSRGRQINSLLKELMTVDLVQLTQSTDIQLSVNSQRMLLPKRIHSTSVSPFNDKQAISKHWQPQPTLFNDICALVGLIDTHFEQDELGEFIAYWLGRNEVVISDYQWTQKFVQHLKRKKTAISNNSAKQTGTQVHSNTVSSLEADDNAKRLVAKYKKVKNNK